MAQCAARLKCPQVGYVVTKVVELKLESKILFELISTMFAISLITPMDGIFFLMENGISEYFWKR